MIHSSFQIQHLFLQGTHLWVARFVEVAWVGPLSAIWESTWTDLVALSLPGVWFTAREMGKTIALNWYSPHRESLKQCLVLEVLVQVGQAWDHCGPGRLEGSLLTCNSPNMCNTSSPLRGSTFFLLYFLPSSISSSVRSWPHQSLHSPSSDCWRIIKEIH